MAFTYTDVQTDALIGLKDTAKATYDDTLMVKLVNDAVQIARKLIARRNPELIWATKAINLVEDNAGPYEISSDFESPVALRDEYGRKIGKGYRGQNIVSQVKGKPDGWWSEGYAPANLYVNMKPDQAYAWTLYYIATAARKALAAFGDNVPLPDFCREPLVEWVQKFAAQSQEYATAEEDEKIVLMQSLLDDILLSRGQGFEFEMNDTGL